MGIGCNRISFTLRICNVTIFSANALGGSRGDSDPGLRPPIPLIEPETAGCRQEVSIVSRISLNSRWYFFSASTDPQKNRIAGLSALPEITWQRSLISPF